MIDEKSTETWASLAPEFQGYEVSSTGLVRTTGANPRILKARRVSSGGAPVVFLLVPDATGTRVRTPRSLSMLVAAKFLPNPLKLTRLRFKDGDMYNAAATNLAWVVREQTQKANDKRTLGIMAQTHIQQGHLNALDPVAQRRYFTDWKTDPLPMPYKGVMFKPLDPVPTEFDEYEQALIARGHVSYDRPTSTTE